MIGGISWRILTDSTKNTTPRGPRIALVVERPPSLTTSPGKSRYPTARAGKHPVPSLACFGTKSSQNAFSSANLCPDWQLFSDSVCFKKEQKESPSPTSQQRGPLFFIRSFLPDLSQNLSKDALFLSPPSKIGLNGAETASWNVHGGWKRGCSGGLAVGGSIVLS